MNNSQLTKVRIRPVTSNDLPVLYGQQLDAEANQMAFTHPRSADDFDAHWAKILSDPSVRGFDEVGPVGTWIIFLQACRVCYRRSFGFQRCTATRMSHPAEIHRLPTASEPTAIFCVYGRIIIALEICHETNRPPCAAARGGFVIKCRDGKDRHEAGYQCS